MTESMLRTTLAAISVVLFCACDRGQQPEGSVARPNIVVITVDTLRADRLGCYGFELARTPNIDRLATQGVRVDHAIAPTPLTLPSHTSIFTGLEPPAHGVRHNAIYHVPDQVQTLAERLKTEGYQTQAFVSAMVLHRRYNLNQGFDGYDDQLWSEDDPRAFMIRERSGPRTMDRVLEWLDAYLIASEDRAPFFLWVHLFDPHAPHEPPAADGKFAPTPYDGEIASVDRQVGRFVEVMQQRDALDDTVLVFTSDHGESLGDHGEKTHGIFVYESTVRVPLILRYPRKLPSGKVYEASVRSVDLMPTILGLADIEPNETQGVDLSRALAGAARPPSLPQYSESLHPELEYGMAPLHGLRLDEWTYIRAPRAELYNRAKDPNETHNLLELSAEDPSVAIPEAAKIQAAKLDQRLTKVLEDSKGFGFVSQANPLDQETIDMLRALGYMADPDAKEGLEGMDPKDGLQVYAQLIESQQLLHDGDHAASAKLLRSLLQELPENVSALNTLAVCEVLMGNPKAAEQHYLKSLAVMPRQYTVLVELGRIYLAERKYESARARFLEALKVVPASVEAMTLMGYLHLNGGRPEDAKRWYDRAIEEDPNYPQAYLGYGDLHLAAHNYQEAKGWYDKALKLQPQSSDGWQKGGVCALGMGDTITAERYLLRAAQIDPESWHPLYLLAVARAAQGDSNSALSYLEKAAERGFSNPALLLHKNLASLQGNPRLERLARRLAGSVQKGAHAAPRVTP
jgi:arylsulfatase A-like enzyme/Tfp pilus assembly protein PilF